MPAATKEKSCHMDVRISERQRSSYELAAELRGQTLTQWSAQHLDEAARHDIEDANTTWLSPESFDVFCRLLDEPTPEAVRQLLERKEIWA